MTKSQRIVAPLLAALVFCAQSADCWSSELRDGRRPRTALRLPQRATSSVARLRAKGPPTDVPETETENAFFFPWNKSSAAMENQVELLVDQDTEMEKANDNPSSPLGALLVAAGIAATAALALMDHFDLSTADVVQKVENIIQDPQSALDEVVRSVDSMGSLGVIYFGVAYTIAEILAIPAIPLTASAGYLFGPALGTSAVLVSASIAAAVSFLIGRTLLRTYVEGVLEDYPKFAKIDRAIGKEGFKLMFLLRLSPIFPFALSNYLYGASSIDFGSFFFGTLFGFAPGTFAYVYTGYVGKALTDGAEGSYPWYAYLGGLAVFAGFLKVAADTATQIVSELEEEEEEEEEEDKEQNTI